jgi:hypothetical protein
MRSIDTRSKTYEVPHQGAKNFYPIPNPPRTPWEVYDEHRSTRACEAPGERGVGRLLSPQASYGLSQARRLSIQYRLRRLRRDIPGPEPCSTGGDDDINVTTVGPLDQMGHDSFGLIRDDVPFYYPMAVLDTPGLQNVSAPVLPLTPTASIGNRKDPDTKRLRGREIHRRTEPSV